MTMNNPTSPKYNNNNDEEAPQQPPLSSSSAAPPPAHLYPQEISFHPPHLHHHNTTFNDDDNTIPSELSTLIAPSTLTPNYNNDQLHHARHAAGGGGVCSHPAIAIGTPGIDNDSRTSYNKSQRAFQLAALLGKQ